MLQAKRRRSAAQAHPRRSSATPKRAELNEQDAAPSTAALPAQQMADDAQQDEMQMESSQGGATAGSPAGPAAGSPAGEAMDSQAGSGHQSDPSERQAPRTLASRISRFAEIFTGCKSTADTPTGKCSAFDRHVFVTSENAMIQGQSMVSLQATCITGDRLFCRHKQFVAKGVGKSPQL